MIAVIVVIIIAVLLKYRKFGRKLYAIGGNRQSALMMGLNVKRTMFQAYVLDGFLAGLGGFLFCLNSCAGFVEQAKGLEMDAISSAVIGGTLLSGGVGTPIGTLFGVLIKGTISQFDYYSGYVIKLVGKNYSFTVTVFLYCNSVSDCFYEEESEISDCIMKQAGTWMGSGLFFVLTEGTRETASLCGFSSGS